MSKLGARRAGVVSLAQRVVAQIRNERRRGRPRKVQPVHSGMGPVQRALHEARLAVRLPRVPVSAYGTTYHSQRRAYDLSVHREFHRNLKRAGIAVEGA